MDSSAIATITTARQDYRVLGVISTGHFMSHFYFLVLPPLFPFLKQEFGVSYTELGVLMTAIYASSAVSQIPVGFMVDRYGARVVLTFGLIMMAVGFGAMGLVSSFWLLIVFGIIAATGNSVFHPADYAILNSSINPERMGRAFSIHTFAGHLGSAVAPITIIFLAAQFGWRGACIGAGAFGIAVMLALTTQWGSLHDDAIPKKKKEEAQADAQVEDSTVKSGLGLLFSKTMITFFLFFMALSMTSSGMSAFFVSSIVALHEMPLQIASTALTAYLFCSALGILLGGEIADRTKRHDLVAAASFVVFAIVSLIIAWFNMPAFVLFMLMVFSGFGNGIIRPARDMMLRAAAPKGSTGKVFGFVSAGIAAGSAVAPIPFGYMLDIGKPEWVFYLMAIFMVVALVTVAVPKTTGPKQAD
ncbi:MAG: FSR family fosmidomycin resistance protein-like MFS transporter [Alphaproteobacteria bacterium]|jgi:FSR family fosmidomycin resistance protein-like MFS transporter